MKQRSALSSWPFFFAYALLGIILAVHFSPVLIGQQRLAFRDTSHFYTPLYQYIAARETQQWLPLWNPLDLNGLPLTGETTTAVYYPIRFVVYRFVSSAESAVAWYVVLHLVIAAIAIHVAAKTVGAGSLGIALAVLMYPLSGPIFFLIYNPPFLVGAAWMPISLAGGLRILKAPTPFWIGATAFSLAMPILGGDPQSAVHVIMIGAAIAVARFIGTPKRRTAGYREGSNIQGSYWRTRVGALLAVLLLTACIAAPQLAATLDWSLQSGRVVGAGFADQLEFSVSPVHWVEFLIPDASGRLFPVFTRISSLWDGSARTWVTTLAAGILPFIFVVNRISKCTYKRFDAWDSLIPTGLMLSMSGPYWLLLWLIPGYDAFRYPAKWLPVAMIGFAIATARQANRVRSQSGRRSLTNVSLLIATVALTIGALAFLSDLAAMPSMVSAQKTYDRSWGPLQLPLAIRTAAISAIVSVLCAGAAWWLFRRIRFGDGRMPAQLHVGFIVLLAVELFIISRPQMAVVNRKVEQERLSEKVEIRGQRGLRTQSQEWHRSFALQSDAPGRILDVEVSQRLSQFGRWHLADGNAIFNSVTSIRSQRMDAFWFAIAEHRFSSDLAKRSSEWERIMQWLGIDYQIACGDGSVAPIPNGLETTMLKWHPQWRSIVPAREITSADISLRLSQILDVDQESLPILETVAIQSDHRKTVKNPSARVELIDRSPESWTVEVNAEAAGVLEFKQFQDGNWHATLWAANSKGSLITSAGVAPSAPCRAAPCEVCQLDYMMTGIMVPEGRWTLRLNYRPWWLTISLVNGWLGVLMGGVLMLNRPLLFVLRGMKILPSGLGGLLSNEARGREQDDH